MQSLHHFNLFLLPISDLFFFLRGGNPRLLHPFEEQPDAKYVQRQQQVRERSVQEIDSEDSSRLRSNRVRTGEPNRRGDARDASKVVTNLCVRLVLHERLREAAHQDGIFASVANNQASRERLPENDLSYFEREVRDVPPSYRGQEDKVSLSTHTSPSPPSPFFDFFFSWGGRGFRTRQPTERTGVPLCFFSVLFFSHFSIRRLKGDSSFNASSNFADKSGGFVFKGGRRTGRFNPFDPGAYSLPTLSRENSTPKRETGRVSRPVETGNHFVSDLLIRLFLSLSL